MKIIRKEPNMGVLRITPHHSVLNSTARKFQSTMHELLSVEYAKYPWQHGGMYITIKPNPSLWWITRMTPESIEFYVAMPDEFIESFKIKFLNHDQWKQCTIDEVEYSPLEAPSGLYKAKLTRHDMFSLSYDFTRQTEPIRDLLNVSNELKDGEAVELIIRCESLSRSKWQQIADYAWEQWEKGNILHRKGLDPVRTITGVFRLVGQLALEVKMILEELMVGIERSFFHTQEEFKKPERVKIPNPDRTAIGEPSRQSHKKRNLPVFKTDIRAVIQAPDEVRIGALGRSLESAFNDLQGDNRVQFVRVNIRAKQELNNLSNWKLRDFDNNLLSVEEMAKLVQLPTRELQQEFKERLVSNHKVEIDIPKDFLDDSGIYMGTSSLRGEEYKVYWPIKDKDMAFTSRAFIGSPRMGKDQDCINMVVDACKKGIGAVIPDVIDERNGHRGMADAIRDHLPADKIVDLNLGDFDWPIYLGLDSITRGKNQRIASNRIAQELTNFLMGDDIENHQTREYLREFAKAVKGDLIGIKLMAMSSTFREQIIDELKDTDFDTLAIENYHSMSEGKQNQVAGPILVRLGELLGDEFLKPLFGQLPNPSVDLKRWMQEGKVVLFRIPSRELGESAVKIIVYWIVLLTFLTGLTMDGKNPGTFLVLNEPHQFLSKGLIHFCKRILVEGPKYRISPVFLFHNFSLLPNDFVQILLSASLNWHIFKNTNIEVYKKLDSYLSPTFEPDQAMSATPRFHFIANWLNSSGEYQTPFMVKAPDLVSKRYSTTDNSEITKTHSKKYGRPIDEIIKQIQDRQRIIYK